jgi:hypothetical protein
VAEECTRCGLRDPRVLLLQRTTVVGETPVYATRRASPDRGQRALADEIVITFVCVIEPPPSLTLPVWPARSVISMSSASRRISSSPFSFRGISQSDRLREVLIYTAVGEPVRGKSQLMRQLLCLVAAFGGRRSRLMASCGTEVFDLKTSLVATYAVTHSRSDAGVRTDAAPVLSSTMTNRCRLCEVTTGDLVKYGIRHYAHAECALTKWGSLFFNKLTQHQCEQFPALVAHRHKLLPALEARIARLKAQERPAPDVRHDG